MFVSEFPDEVRQHFFEHSCKVLTESCLSGLLLETRVMYAHPAKKFSCWGKVTLAKVLSKFLKWSIYYSFMPYPSFDETEKCLDVEFAALPSLLLKSVVLLVTTEVTVSGDGSRIHSWAEPGAEAANFRNRARDHILLKMD